MKREYRLQNQNKDENRNNNTKPPRNNPRARVVRENDPSEFAFAADGRVADVTGKGTGKLCCSNYNGKKSEIALSDVLLVPELDAKLISVSQLANKGREVRFTAK